MANEMSPQLLELIKERIQRYVHRAVQRRFAHRQNEDHFTGALAMAVEDGVDREPLRWGGWEALITFEGYSPREEAESGADFAIVVTIRNRRAGETVRKAMLVQAKIAPESGTAPYASALLRNEIATMLSHTSEAYVVGYSCRAGVVAYDATAYAVPAHREPIPFELLVVESIECSRGDRSPALLRYAERRPRLKVDVEG